ncbi:MAG: UPF0146 family protein [Thermodesulfovibrionales bacterium]
MYLSTKYKGFIDFIAQRYNRVVEIGIGRFPFISYSLIERGLELFATDIYPVEFRGIKVVQDDVIRPNVLLYSGIDALFSLRPPPEIVPYMVNLAERISADLLVKPLSSDFLGGEFRCYKNSTFFLWEQI